MKSMEPFIKIIVIAKENTSLRLTDTLNRLMEQSYAAVSVIVADINYSNNEYSIGLREDLEKYPQISYVKFDEYLSMDDIYNHFIREAEDGYIGFINSMDLWDRNTGTLVMDEFRNHDGAGAIFFNGILHEEQVSSVNTHYFFRGENSNPLERVLTLQVLSTAQVIYDVSALKSIGGFRKGYTALTSAETLIRLSQKWRIGSINLPLCESFSFLHEKNYSELLMDYKALHLNHIDVFLADKGANAYYYNTLFQLASKSYVWIHYILYISLFFIKYPLKSIGYFLGFLKKIAGQTFNHIGRTLLMMVKMSQLFYERWMVLMDKEILFNPNIKEQELRKLEIPSHIKIIDTAKYFNDKSLEIVEIPNNVVEIKNYAFHSCTNLKEIIFHDGSQLERIGSFAFANCIHLRKIQIGGNLRTINSHAFMGCKSLFEIITPEKSTLTEIKKGVFLGCIHLHNLILTSKVKEIGDYAFAGCHQLKTSIFYQIDALESLGKGAFMNCKSLDYFQLSSQMNEIKKKTFYGCSGIKTMKVPRRIKSIQKMAFRKCSSLTKITLLAKDVVIAPYAFDKDIEIERADL